MQKAFAKYQRHMNKYGEGGQCKFKSSPWTNIVFNFYVYKYILV